MVVQQAIYVDRRCETNTIRRPDRPPVGEWSGLLDILLLHFDTIYVCSTASSAKQILDQSAHDMLVILQHGDAHQDEGESILSDARMLRHSIGQRPANALLAGMAFPKLAIGMLDLELAPTSLSVGHAVTQLSQDDTRTFENPELAPTRMEWRALRSRMQYDGRPSSLVNELINAHVAQSKFDASLAENETENTMLNIMASSWAFSCLDLPNEDVVQVVFIIFKHVLSQPGMEQWRLSDPALLSFINTVRSGYHHLNPYHNFRHAADVLQALFYFSIASSALPCLPGTSVTGSSISTHVVNLFTPRFLLALMIVGIGHDLGHPGVNNAFLVASQAPLALLYNDRSVLENLHGAALSLILRKHWPATQETATRKIILELVLSTDMALHFDYMSKFKEIGELRAAAALKPPSTTDAIDKLRLTIFAGLVKCADVCNVARPLDISKRWSSALLREFFNQGRLEQSLGMPQTKAFDPEQTLQADSQIFFTDMFAVPLFRSLLPALPCLDVLVAQMESNRAYWSEVRSSRPGLQGSGDEAGVPAEPSRGDEPKVESQHSGCFTLFQRKR